DGLSDGNSAEPYARLVQGVDGSFYGSTLNGGTSHNGMVFRITADGVFTNLHSFNVSDGSRPYAGLVQGTDCFLDGSTTGGGLDVYGPFLKIPTNGEFATLHSVTATDSISNPIYDLVQGPNGNLYGVTPTGGAYGKGNIFRMTTNGV